MPHRQARALQERHPWNLTCLPACMCPSTAPPPSWRRASSMPQTGTCWCSTPCFPSHGLSRHRPWRRHSSASRGRSGSQQCRACSTHCAQSPGRSWTAQPSSMHSSPGATWPTPRPLRSTAWSWCPWWRQCNHKLPSRQQPPRRVRRQEGRRPAAAPVPPMLPAAPWPRATWRRPTRRPLWLASAPCTTTRAPWS